MICFCPDCPTNIKILDDILSTFMFMLMNFRELMKTFIFHRYLITWFIQSVHVSFKKICGAPVTMKSTKIEIKIKMTSLLNMILLCTS